MAKEDRHCGRKVETKFPSDSYCNGEQFIKVADLKKKIKNILSLLHITQNSRTSLKRIIQTEKQQKVLHFSCIVAKSSHVSELLARLKRGANISCFFL